MSMAELGDRHLDDNLAGYGTGAAKSRDISSVRADVFCTAQRGVDVSARGGLVRFADCQIQFCDCDEFSSADVANAILAEFPVNGALPKWLAGCDSSHVRESGQAPLLSKSQEFECFRAYNFHLFRAAKAQEELHRCRGSLNSLCMVREHLQVAYRIRNRLIEANLRLVVSVARKFAGNTQLCLDDMIGVGNGALLKAVERFDHTRGWRFSTYAYTAIYRTILDFVRSEQRRREIAVGETQNLEPMLIGDAGAADRDELEAAESKARISEAMHVLNDREFRIVCARFGIGSHEKPQTLQRIGDHVGLSKQRIGTILRNALLKMRKHMCSQTAAKGNSS